MFLAAILVYLAHVTRNSYRVLRVQTQLTMTQSCIMIHPMVTSIPLNTTVSIAPFTVVVSDELNLP